MYSLQRSVFSKWLEHDESPSGGLSGPFRFRLSHLFRVGILEGRDILGIDLRKRAVAGADVVLRSSQPRPAILVPRFHPGVRLISLLGFGLLQKLLRRRCIVPRKVTTESEDNI